MIAEIKINPHNRKAYLDLLQDMYKQKEGVFTFTLRVASGQIVDYVKSEVEFYEPRRGVTKV